MAIELADILREYGPAYRQKYAEKLLPSHRQVMWAIENCRTEALGGQVYSCPACQEFQYSYHSCRNRHCPKCQHEQTQDWLEVQRELLLPVPYFMLTFTLPAQLRALVSKNQKLMYNLLFRTSAQVTQALALDVRYVGGQIGMIGVLHTWTRKLIYHPHVHYLVPGGGVGANDDWLPVRNKFLLPVRALSKLFRAAFWRALKNTVLFQQIPKAVWQKEWVVHCKSIGDGQAALKYLAPYIHRVAISNRRLVGIEHRGSLETSQVTFQYRTSDTGQLKRCTLTIEQFLQRFLQHVLPAGFVKVRYYGFFGATRRDRLVLLQRQLAPLVTPGPVDEPETEASKPQTGQKITCSKCGLPMLFKGDLPPVTCRSP